jgi:hypothetical protein
MSGVFDCHAHVAIGSLDLGRLLNQPISRWALEASVNMRQTLEAGVTFVRDAAGADADLEVGNGCEPAAPVFAAGSRAQTRPFTYRPRTVSQPPS